MFDLYEQVNPVNHDILINYNSEDYSPCKVIIYKDDNIYSELDFEGNFNINLTESGSYKLVIPDRSIESGIYNIDKEAPIINIKEKYIKSENDINILDYVTATDNGVDISDRITYTDSIIKKDVKKVTVSVSDVAGNVSTKDIIVSDIGSQTSILFLQVIFILILILMVMGVYI